jgi:prefoldin subunit 5
VNEDRRKKIDELISTLEQLKADIETVRDEEQEYFDNMPESFQSGSKGDAVTAAIDALETALSSCEEVSTGLEDAKS